MRAFLLAIVCAVTAATPVELQIPTRSITVRGVVRDSATAKPLGGVSVALVQDGAAARAEARSDTLGNYVLKVSIDPAARELKVVVRLVGYQQLRRAIPITGDTLTADFALLRVPVKLDHVVVTAAPSAQDSRAVASASVVTESVRLRGSTGFLRSAAPAVDPRQFNTEEYGHIEDNKFIAVSSSPLSTFSVDVDRASYTNVRRFIRGGTMPPKDAVRIEELINYFPYSYAAPRRNTPVSITTDIADAPWNANHRIVRIGLQTARIETAELPASNLVFLIDVSGSMQPANKLPLVKQAFRLLVNELRPQDRVAIVVYAGAAGLVLPSTSASKKESILAAIEQLEAGGSTAGGAGIRLAYDVAKQNYIRGGNNRVVLATDGDFNVGVSSTSELVRLVEEKREEGSALTILGFGMGNLKDGRMEQLADKGNGNYAYVDDLLEARKVFVKEFGGTLVTVAKDVKLQVEFNPAMVQAYRLIGYENRLLRNEDFTDDKKDAGDMGAGHSVTALYEIVPAGVKLDVEVGTTPALRYQRTGERAERATETRELLHVSLRYKHPTDSVSRLMQQAVVESRQSVDADFTFAIAVAGYGMLLRESPFKGKLTYDAVLSLARGALGEDPDRYRAEFVSLVEETKRVAAKSVTAGVR